MMFIYVEFFRSHPSKKPATWGSRVCLASYWGSPVVEHVDLYQGWNHPRGAWYEDRWSGAYGVVPCVVEIAGSNLDLNRTQLI